MKKVLIITCMTILVSCGVQKEIESPKEKIDSNITGLYMGEEIPADIGQPYKVYLNFSTDSVWIANFSTECSSTRELIKSNYDNKTKVNEGSPISFSFENLRRTFIDNIEVEKKYKSVYKCIYQSKDSLKFEVSNYWFDGTLFYKSEELYYQCE